MGEHRRDSAGRLNRLSRPAASQLDGVATRDLAAALRTRLRAAATPPTGGDTADQLGLLSIELEVLVDVFGNRFSRKRVNEVFLMASRFLQTGQLRLEDAAIVEFGCGSVNPLAALMVHVLAGARFGYGYELDPPQDHMGAVRALARIATYMLAEPAFLATGVVELTREAVARNFAGFDLVKLWQGDPAGIDPRRLQLRNAPAERTGLADASIDFIYSVSFLEHVVDPATVVAELARITRPGGCGTHSIDGKDHRCYGQADLHPLGFLREPAGPEIVHGSNRLRPLEFVPLFERHGFEVQGFDVHERVAVSAELRAQFAPPFRYLNDETLMAVGGMIFVCRR